MCLVAICYAVYLKVKNPNQASALAQGVSYKQIISGFFFAFAALTYLISAQPDMNGLATGFILSQTSVVLATLTGIWFLHESKTQERNDSYSSWISYYYRCCDNDSDGLMYI